MHGCRHLVSCARLAGQCRCFESARGMHGWRHLVSWVVEARRPLKPCRCLEVLEAYIIGGILFHGWSSFAGFSSHVGASRCSRHSWLEAYCLMGGRRSHAFQSMVVSRGFRGMHGCRHLVSWVGGRGSQASQGMFVSRGFRGMHGWGHLASWMAEARRPFKPLLGLSVLEACMVGEASCLMGGQGSQASQAM